MVTESTKFAIFFMYLPYNNAQGNSHIIDFGESMEMTKENVFDLSQEGSRLHIFKHLFGKTNNYEAFKFSTTKESTMLQQAFDEKMKINQ